jgi:hypothetical protein
LRLGQAPKGVTARDVDQQAEQEVLTGVPRFVLHAPRHVE